MKHLTDFAFLKQSSVNNSVVPLVLDPPLPETPRIRATFASYFELLKQEHGACFLRCIIIVTFQSGMIFSADLLLFQAKSIIPKISKDLK